MTAEAKRSGCEWLHCWYSSDKHHVECAGLTAKLDEMREEIDATHYALDTLNTLLNEQTRKYHDTQAKCGEQASKIEEQAQEIERLHTISLDVMRERDALRPECAKATRKSPLPDCSGFESFWASYPRKDAKPYAEKCWNKLAPGKHLQETINADVVRKSQTWKWRQNHGEFIPMPSTYLNQRRWEDEGVPEPAPPPPKAEILCVVTDCPAEKIPGLPWCAEHQDYREKALGLKEPQV